MGLGNVKTCSVHMALASNVINLSAGVIEADVTIALPIKFKVHDVYLVLYEDVDLKVGKNYDEGGKQDPRVICHRKYKTKQFTSMDSTGMTQTLSGRLKLKIADPAAEEYGPLGPILESRFLTISHRVGVEISLLMGSRVSVRPCDAGEQHSDACLRLYTDLGKILSRRSHHTGTGNIDFSVW